MLLLSTVAAVSASDAIAAERGGGGFHGGGGFRGGSGLQGGRGFHGGGDFHGGHADISRGLHADFHGRDFARFSGPERRLWEGGNWTHDWHGGRYGWWWVVDDDWYFYPEPVYPYPTYVPPAIVGQVAPPTPSGLPPAENWYYCDNPIGYYPYIASCNAQWRAVPVTPQPQELGATPSSPPPG